MTSNDEPSVVETERGERKVKLAIVTLWATTVSLVLGVFLFTQHSQNDRANKRIDRIEQVVLPGKAAVRDQQYTQLSNFACGVVAATPKDSELRKLARANGLTCPTVAPKPQPKPSTPATSSTPEQGGAVVVIPGGANGTTTVIVPGPTTTRTVPQPKPPSSSPAKQRLPIPPLPPLCSLVPIPGVPC